jgi:glycosyltransferase involved in cell wall biosynthesis
MDYLRQKIAAAKYAVKRQLIMIFWRDLTRSDKNPYGESHERILNRQARKAEFGVNLAGFFTGRFGVAASARAFADALTAAQVPHVLNKVISEFHGERHSTRLLFTSINPYAVNLIHVNPDMTEYFINSMTSLIHGPRYFNDRYNIGIWYWETSRFPTRWIPYFRFHDEIWAVSSFIVESLSKVSPIPIIRMRFPLFVNTSVIDLDARQRLGLQDDECVFLFVFDFASTIQRKNPIGLVRAFGQAFDRNDRALLLLSHINSVVDPHGLRILEEESAHLNVKMLGKHLSEQEYLSLLATCDCYVSLHRSEGFGLPIAEAMYLGKPVIATAYGGNIDFMNVNNSFPLNYELVELERDYGLYEKGSVWAEPDIGRAGELMRWVYHNRELARGIGQRAASDIRETMNPTLAAQEMRARLELIYAKNSSLRR